MKIILYREEIKRLEQLGASHLARNETNEAREAFAKRQVLFEIHSEDVYHRLAGTHPKWTN